VSVHSDKKREELMWCSFDFRGGDDEFSSDDRIEFG
jgi:hypothetical protein